MNQVAGRFTGKISLLKTSEQHFTNDDGEARAASRVQDGFAKSTPGTFRGGFAIHGEFC